MSPLKHFSIFSNSGMELWGSSLNLLTISKINLSMPSPLEDGAGVWAVGLGRCTGCLAWVAPPNSSEIPTFLTWAVAGLTDSTYFCSKAEVLSVAALFGAKEAPVEEAGLLDTWA